MDQKLTLMEVTELLDEYCDQCFLNHYHKKEYGKCYAQRFCIKNCTVGQKLKEYGKKLS